MHPKLLLDIILVCTHQIFIIRQIQLISTDKFYQSIVVQNGHCERDIKST